jgi:hypothetical protein
MLRAYILRRIFLLQRSKKDGDVFMSRIITGYETWVHRYDPLTKRQSMELHHQSARKKKKIKKINKK